MHRAFLWGVCAGVCLAALEARTATNTVADLSRFSAVPACAPLMAAAQVKNIPLEQIDPATDEDQLDPGIQSPR